MRSACLAAAIAAVLVSGCARAPATPDREPFADAPWRTVSPEELRHRIDAGSASVTSVRGKLDLGLRETADGRYRTCRGALAASNPWSGRRSPGMYLQGYRSAMPAFFTLVSAGLRFWLHVPRDNVVYTGPIARRRGAGGARDLRLDARDLFRALFVQPVAALDEVEVEEEPASYVLSVFHQGRLLRRIWGSVAGSWSGARSSSTPRAGWSWRSTGSDTAISAAASTPGGSCSPIR
jgi:hypothetical protein